MPVIVFLGIDLSVWLIALGVVLMIALVVYIVDGIVKIIDKTVGRLPLIGGLFGSAAHTLQRAFVEALAPAAEGAQSIAGAALHALAREVDWVGREIRRHANLLYTIAALLVGPAVVNALRSGISTLHGTTDALAHRITAAYARVLSLEHRLQHTITTGVLPRLGRLEREYDRVIDKDIAGLRSRTKAVEKSLDDVWKYVRSHPWTVATDAFVGAVAVALSRLGLGWIRCPTAGQVFNKRGCNLWNDLDKLLSLAADVFLVANMCRVIPWLEEAFSVVAAPLIAELTDIGAGLCNPGDSPPELLPGVTLHLPASPGYTLHLP